MAKVTFDFLQRKKMMHNHSISDIPGLTNLILLNVENRIVTLEEAAAGEIVLEADFINVIVVFKNGIALYPTQYTLTGSTVAIPDILENDTLIFILS